MAPCWEQWPLPAAEQAQTVFAYDAEGRAHRHVELERYTDYLHSYCLSVNAALGEKLEVERAEPWWKRWLTWMRDVLNPPKTPDAKEEAR